MTKILAVYEAEGQAEMEWFKGCKSGPWKPCTERCQGEKGLCLYHLQS